jgi:predicted PurR-regulated permease PerM
VDSIGSRQRDSTVTELVRSSQVQIRFGGLGAPTVVAIVLIALGVFVMLPVLPPILVGAWIAGLARPLVPTLVKGLRKESAATLVTTLLVISVLVPCAVLCVTISFAAIDLWRTFIGSASIPEALAILGQTDAGATSSEQFLSLAREYASSTLSLASSVLGAAGDGALQLFVLVLSCYAFLAYDRRFYTFCLLRLPIAPKHVERLRLAFHETGRSLLIGTGLTCLVQAVVGSAVYFALGVPRALVLGGVTFVAAFLPGLGTALVWGPVAAGLALTGHHAKAAVLLLLGATVIGSLDNLLRPWIAQRTKLALPPIVTLLSMLGGLAVLGGWGLLLGPLVVRLAMEALEILREERDTTPVENLSTPREPIAGNSGS